ncbi:MAG: phosphoglucosamine mutase [Solirubrobacterales bacterium]|nr:phosphoglucosamine mutase [Solirubrobacterales bacterium]
MAARLFGTDGVRGAYGSVLSVDLALAIGRAASQLADAERPRALIIRDTRESGPVLEAGLAAGVAAAGGDVLLGGVLPTPAAPMLLSQYGFDLAFVVSASHNPFGDNGIKIFGSDGDKISDAAEDAIEDLIASGDFSEPSHPGRIDQLRGAFEDYIRGLEQRYVDLDLTGMRILLDCANGATSAAAPEICRRLGADVDSIHDQPDGRNINENCGSTHVELLAEQVAGKGWDAAFAFDGDGDRVLAVDGSGAIVDGDDLLLLLSGYLQENGALAGGVAVTVMANYGLHGALSEAEVEVAITPVGDRHVLAALRERGWRIGGEQSGHIIDLELGPCGDGIAVALLSLEALAGAPLVERPLLERLPQRLVNVRIRDRNQFASNIELAEIIERESAALEGRGRLLVRASGTQPLIRVMAEAPTQDEAEAVCQLVAGEIAQRLGE